MICDDCFNDKAIHSLCKGCMQKIIDKSNKQGALEELRKVWSLPSSEAWEYMKKRIEELESVKGGLK